MKLKVTRVDVPNHRLLLSVKAWLTDQDDVTLAEWTANRNRARAEAAKLEAEEAEKAKEREEKKGKRGPKDASAAAEEADLPADLEGLDDVDVVDADASLASEVDSQEG
jgi:hypothetical protein